jgi:hypothetical protein
VLWITLSDAYQKEMGGKSDSLQSMQVRNQQPLSSEDMLSSTDLRRVEPPDKPEEEEFRSNAPLIRSSEDEDTEFEWCSGPPSSDSEDEDEETPIGEDIVTVEPFSLEAITCPIIPIIQVSSVPWEDPDIKADRLFLSTMKEWREDYHWDYTARKVAVRWLEYRKEGGFKTELLRNLWHIFGQDAVIGPIFQETYKKALKGLFRWAHKMEWDVEILRKLPKLRRADPTIDHKLACLVYYNSDISRSERDRRLDSLWIEGVNKAIDDCNALRAAPKPETWNIDETPKFSDETWSSVTENWETASKEIERIPSITRNRRREAFKEFYDLEWACWKSQLGDELFEYKLQDRLFSPITRT